MKHRFPIALSFLLFLAGPTRAQKPELVVETGHTFVIYSVAFSPSGRILASASRDKSIKLWDVATGRELRSLTGHRDDVTSVAFSPDGRILASGSFDLTIKLWDVATGRELKTLSGHDNLVNSVAFSPDGKTLASGSGDDTINLWDVTNGTELKSLTGHTSAVNSVVFSPDGKLLASGSQDKTIKLWDITSMTELRTLTGHTDWVKSIAFSADGHTLASRGLDRDVKFWDVASGRELQATAGQSGDVTAIALSSRGTTLFTGGNDGTIRFWDFEVGLEFRTILSPTAYVSSMAISPDGQTLASGNGDGTIKLWDAQSGLPLNALTGHAAVVECVAVSPDGRTVASGGLNRLIKLRDLATGRQLHTLSGHTGPVSSLGFSPDGKMLASGSGDRTIKLWDVASGREVGTLTGQANPVMSLTFSADGRTLASAGLNGIVKIWDLDSRHELRTLTNDSDDPDLWCGAFSPDGKTLVCANMHGRFDLWDVQTGQVLRKLAGEDSFLYPIALSPDGRTFASKTLNDTFELWDLETGHKLRTLTGRADSIQSISFSPDGRVLIGGSEDGSIRFWDLDSAKELAALFPLDTDDWAVLDPEGRFDASAGGMQLMHWIVGLEPIDLAQLKQRYYDPGLLQKVLGFNKEPLRDVSAFTDAKLFPEVTTEAPSPASTKLVLNLKNRGGGIGRVQVFVNGKELIADARGPKPDPAAVATSLTVDLAGAPIKPGEANDIRVVTWNQEGYLSSRGVNVTWHPIGEQSAAPPDLYAIVVGISEYSAKELNLRFASKDAADMAHALDLGAQRLLGADHVHVTLLTSPANEGAVLASKENIRKAFEAARRAKPGDILVVYLAGHGVAIQDLYAYPTQDARTLNLSDPSIRAQTAISSDELVEWMNQVPALHDVTIIDTCAAAAAAAPLVEMRAPPGDQVRAIERLKDRTGVYVLMGSAADAVSYEASQYGQGLLTYALLKGMKGSALRDDKYVDVARLFQAAEDEVPLLARDIGGIQQPRIASPGGASFDIGELLPEDRRAIPLANARPILLRPLFINAQLHRDNLGLSKLLSDRLREQSYESPRGSARPPVYLDEDNFPNAVSPSGDYTVEGTQVKVTLVLTREDKEIAQSKVEGTADNLIAITTKLATQINEIMQKQSPP